MGKEGRRGTWTGILSVCLLWFGVNTRNRLCDSGIEYNIDCFLKRPTFSSGLLFPLRGPGEEGEGAFLSLHMGRLHSSMRRQSLAGPCLSIWGFGHLRNGTSAVH